MRCIKSSRFEKTLNGKSISLFTLTNHKGISMQITNYGARMVSLYVPDRNGISQDVVLGYDCIDDYLKTSNRYFGATIGRFANRIANAQFTLHNKHYKLNANDAPHSLHGGTEGFHQVVWDVNQLSDSKLELTYTSQNKEEGFPSTVSVKVTYSISDTNEVSIEYVANTNKLTVINLTNHSYFNLKDAGKSSIEGHQLQILAATYTPVNTTLIPIGHIETVANTPFDFRRLTQIGKQINQSHEQLQIGTGYDHNYILDGIGLRVVAVVKEPTSGRVMEVITDTPGMQFYSGNDIDHVIPGKNKIRYGNRHGFCLETQYFPDSPNQPHFPSTVLNPEDTYRSTTIYKFSTTK